MTSLLEKALERVAALPYDAQDAIAGQILETLKNEESRWVKRSMASIAGQWRDDPEFDRIMEEQRQVNGETEVTGRVPQAL